MDCGVITSKTVLIIISLIFWAAAAGLSYVGAHVLDAYRNIDPFLQDKYAVLPAVIIICVAVVMFIIGLIGCCATIRESRIGLGFFLIVIFLIFAAEVAAFVLGFIYRGKIKTELREPMQQAFEHYEEQMEESHLVDYLQQELQCCGVDNYTDWLNTTWFHKAANNSVPRSCCKELSKVNCTGILSEPQLLNTEGCAMKVESQLQEVINYAMFIILGFAIVKFFGMLSVCVLTCKSENNGYQPLYSGTFA